MEWICVNYNHGNCFDGTYFTVPENGLYCFNAKCWHGYSSTRGEIKLYINGGDHVTTKRESDGKVGFVNIHTTLELVKNDKVDVRFWSELLYVNSDTTYFEGRMIARLNE